MNYINSLHEKGYKRDHSCNIETYEKRMTDKDGTIFYIRIINSDPFWFAVAYFTSSDGVDFEIKINASDQCVRCTESFFLVAYHRLNCVPRFDALST